MGRKSKLTEQQWHEIERRMLEGEPIRALAREFKVSESTIRERKSAQVADIKKAAETIVAGEQALAKLPISAQITAQNLASKLRSISSHIANAADYSAATAHRLSALANQEVQKIDDANPLASTDKLKGVAVLTNLANSASTIGINLLSANKEMIKKGMEDEPPTPVSVIVQVEDASVPET